MGGDATARPGSRGEWDEVLVDLAHTRMAGELAEELAGLEGVRFCADGPGEPAVRDGDVVVGYHFPPGSLAAYDRLRWVHLTGTGTDHLAATGLPRETLVTTSSRVPVTAVAEYAVSGLLYVLKRLDGLGRGREEWFASEALLLTGSTVAVAGAGRIGRAVLRRLAALGARTVAVTRPGRPEVPEADRTVGSDRLAELEPGFDHLVLCLPGGEETRNLIDRNVLSAMREHSVLVNVGRAETVDTEALHGLLRAGRMRGAFLDVHDTEPLPADDPSRTVPGLVVSPHRAFAFPGEPAQVARVFAENLGDLRGLRRPRDLSDHTTERSSAR